MKKLISLLLLAGVVAGAMAGCGGDALPATATKTPTTISAASTPAPEAMPCVTPVPATPTPTAIPPTSTMAPMPASTHVVQGWAVLAVKEDYSDVHWLNLEDLHTGFVSLETLRDLLVGFGWEESHILEVRDSLNQEEASQAVEWLAANSDADDLAFFYIGAHGRFLREVLEWADFIAEDWTRMASQRRVMVVEACHAGEFTAAVAADPRPQLTVASVRSDEFGWCGLPEEGLPIVGGVFTHYFAAAFGDSIADSDSDGAVSIQEAALRAEGQQRDYMHDVVWAVPEFREDAVALSVDVEDPEYPHVVIDDSVGEPVYLDLGAYQTAEAAAAPSATQVAAVATATPVLEPVSFLLVAEDRRETVGSHQPVVAEWRWGVRDPALLEENNNATTFTVTVDGRVVAGGSMAEYRTEMLEEEVDGIPVWFQCYSHPIGAFEAGSSHWLQLERGFSREVTDGCDLDGDGDPNWFGPDSEMITVRLDITVQ